jgi:hypothetical protein
MKQFAIGNAGRGVEIRKFAGRASFFSGMINIEQRLRNRESMLVSSPPSSATTGD